jgi:hypothetical protein
MSAEKERKTSSRFGVYLRFSAAGEVSVSYLKYYETLSLTNMTYEEIR